MALFLAACAPAGEVLTLPPPPEGVQSLFLLIPGAVHAARIDTAPAELPVLTLGPADVSAVIYSRLSLEDLQVEPGLLPKDGRRSLPLIAGVHELKAGVWIEHEGAQSLSPILGEVLLPPVNEATCAEAGGCVRLVDDAWCERPCPCPTSVQALTIPWEVPSTCNIPPAPRVQTCYAEPRRFTALNELGQSVPNSTRAHAGQVVREGDRFVLYFESNRFAVPLGMFNTYYTYLAQVDLVGIDQVDPSTARHVPLIPLPTTQTPIGWTSTGQIRSDGLELFTHSSLPDGNYNDEELFLARRTSKANEFGVMLPITSLTATNNAPVVGDPGDEARRPLLLPDYRTLLFRRGAGNTTRLEYARRPTTEPGTLEFLPIEGQALFDPYGAGQNLSADGQQVLSAVRDREPGRPLRFFASPITALDPEVHFGAPTPLTLEDGQTPVELPNSWDDVSITEHPEGTAIYVGVLGESWILEAVPCR